MREIGHNAALAILMTPIQAKPLIQISLLKHKGERLARVSTKILHQNN